MNISDLQQLFEAHPQITASVKLLAKHKNVFVGGLQSSSASMFAVSMFEKSNAGSFLYILDDAENAGYFYHDLTQIIGQENVLFFPSAYKRSIKYGQIDSANEILRTEVLSRLQSADSRLIIVSYPEALAEKVVAKEVLKENTLKISIGNKLDVSFVSEVLDSYGFEYVDYVYEPGQYAIRGSLVDVFSFSNEYPYRIDFFGDEVETIRTFDVESQLSKDQLKEIQIVPEMRNSNLRRESFLDVLPQNTVVGYKDLSWVEGRLSAIYNDEPILENPEYMKDFKAKLISDADFKNALKQHKQLQFGVKSFGLPEASISFETSVQPIFHKNFDLVSEALSQFQDDGYKIYMLSDSEKQNLRLKTIFEDRGDAIKFVPINKTLHEGFSDHALKV